MYTECPECNTAFRLNAKILRQAHGRVRCGGCGSTFNAIDHLAEDPIDNDTGSNPGNTQTAHIFDERSRALLESLDQLTGPGVVRIEDTGVEWRVLDVEEGPGNDGDPDAAETQVTTDSSPTGTIQWTLEDLNEEPVDDSVTAQYSTHAAAALESSDKPAADIEDEPTYSDETGIAATDDTSHSDEPADEAAAPSLADSADTRLNFDPDDEPAAAGSPQREVRYDDNTPLPDEFYRPSDDFPPERPAEPAAPGPSPAATAPRTDDEPAAELAFGEIDDWQELLAEVAPDDAEPAVATKTADEEGLPATVPQTDGSPETAADAAGDDGDTVVQDMDADESTAAEYAAAPDIQTDTAGTESPPAAIDTATHSGTRLPAEADDEELIAGEFAAEPDPPMLQLEPQPVAEEPAESVANSHHASTQGDDSADSADSSNHDTAFALDGDSDSHPDDPDGEVAKDTGEDARDAAATDTAAVGSDEEVDDPELSVAMEIDQELMRAVAESRSGGRSGRPGAGESMLVETIIMEGDTITDLLTEAEADVVTAVDEPDQPDLDSVDQPLGLDAATSRPPQSPRRRNLTIAAIVVLTLLLAAQLVHANRESLATRPVFERTLGPVYRALGSPVTPAWNVRGWQFESTSGSTDSEDQRLTIRSRIVNKSQQALPYPLVYVALTDRFEEMVGSLILRPDEYLAGGTSARRPVAPDAEFTAVITIDTPAPEATGFKLNVCYRAAPQQLRCAIEDFRD